MDDYISRAEAVKAAMADASPKRTHDFNAGCARAANNVNAILAADVRPVKRGEWVKNEDKVGWHCSACKVDNNFAYSWNSETGKNEFQDNYCPHCGADMRPKPPEREADEEDEP